MVPTELSHCRRMFLIPCLVVVVGLAGVMPIFAEDSQPALDRTGPRIVFLGDSITAAGDFINDIEATLLQSGNRQTLPTIIALGLGSETASGLTEPDHPFPRPNVHERLSRVLKAKQPDVVVACYGINDGIYHPLSEERFAAYRNGIRQLVQDVHAVGARVVLLTPPPYAGRIAPQPAPKEGGPYGYKTPDPNYDAVLAKYAKWILTLADEDGVEVIDIRTPMVKNLGELYEGDAIHPLPAGHRIMAKTILAEWHKVVPAAAGAGLSIPESDERWRTVHKLVSERRQILDRKLLWEIGHQRPGKAPNVTMEEAEQAAARIDEEIATVIGAEPR